MFTLIRHELRSYTLFHDLYSNRSLKFRVNIQLWQPPKMPSGPLKTKIAFMLCEISARLTVIELEKALSESARAR